MVTVEISKANPASLQIWTSGLRIDTKTREQSQVPDFNLLTLSGRPVFYVTSTKQDKILQPWVTVFHGNSIYCTLAQF